MKVRFIAGGIGPRFYSIDGETINSIDLSPLEHGGQFLGNDETEAAGIREAYRDENGTLHVTLKQGVIASKLPGYKAHWRGTGEEIDTSEYDPSKCYVVPTGVADLTEGEDYVIAWGTDVAGDDGWTIKKVEK